MEPKQFLLSGVDILAPVLRPHGFRFRLREAGRGSGGHFAWGEYSRLFRRRRLELHFRWSLGLVRYHVGGSSAAHERYMQELGVWDRCQYPGYANDPLQAFHGLAHDLRLADDFLRGDAQVLERAAVKERLHLEQEQRDDMAHAVGDVRALQEMHELFRARRYSDVLARSADIKYPDRLSPAELRMLQIARDRSGG